MKMKSSSASASFKTMDTPYMPIMPKMSYPAIVTLVGYAVLVFIVLMPIDMFTYDKKENKYVKQPYSFWHRLLLALLLLFPFLLSVYSVNCMMIGNCQLWSWIVAFVTLLWAMLLTISTFTSGSFTLDNMLMV